MAKKLSDKEIVETNSLIKISELISYLVPFITYMNSVVMPDQDDSEESSAEENGTEGVEG